MLLSANEVNKAIKEQHRLEEQALDRKYARQYAEKLDNEEKVIPETDTAFWNSGLIRADH